MTIVFGFILTVCGSTWVNNRAIKMTHLEIKKNIIDTEGLEVIPKLDKKKSKKQNLHPKLKKKT